MNKTIRVKGPDNSAIHGNHYIIPLDSFDAKGHKWSRRLIFSLKTSAVEAKAGSVFVCTYWSEPRYEVADCGLTGSWALDGSGWKDCMCAECLKGRKEVANGWTPDKEN